MGCTRQGAGCCMQACAKGSLTPKEPAMTCTTTMLMLFPCPPPQLACMTKCAWPSNTWVQLQPCIDAEDSMEQASHVSNQQPCTAIRPCDDPLQASRGTPLSLLLTAERPEARLCSMRLLCQSNAQNPKPEIMLFPAQLSAADVAPSPSPTA